MFNIPSAKISHVHIALNNVVLTQNVFDHKSPDFPFLQLEIKHWMSYSLSNKSTYVSVYTCVCISICIYILK